MSLRDENVFEPVLDVVNRQIVVAGKADEVVLVAFVITHEDILTMHAAVIVPPTFCLLDGFAFGMIVGGERNVVFSEIAQDFFLSFGYDFDALERHVGV